MEAPASMSTEATPVSVRQATVGINANTVSSIIFQNVLRAFFYSMDRINHSPLEKSGGVQIGQKCLDNLFCNQISTKNGETFLEKLRIGDLCLGHF